MRFGLWLHTVVPPPPLPPRPRPPVVTHPAQLMDFTWQPVEWQRLVVLNDHLKRMRRRERVRA